MAKKSNKKVSDKKLKDVTGGTGVSDEYLAQYMEEAEMMPPTVDSANVSKPKKAQPSDAGTLNNLSTGLNRGFTQQPEKK